MPYEINGSDISVANNKWLPQQEKAIRIMAGFNPVSWEVLEARINDWGSFSQVSWPGGNNTRTDINNDAWGRPKFIQDVSLFHGLFQYDVPNDAWEEASIVWDPYDHQWHTHLPETWVKAISTKSVLEMNSWIVNTEWVLLNSKRNPRYQPNRWHLYSSSIILPEVTNLWFAEFGWLGHDNWVYFKIQWDWAGSYTIKVARRTLDTIFHEVDITAAVEAKLPNLDLTTGNLFDIQLQWRWVWDYFFYINQTLVYTMEMLWTLSYASVANPSMPIWFKCYSLWENYSLRCWCVDLSSEWGQVAARTPRFITTPETLPSTSWTDDTAMIIVRIPRHITYDWGQVHASRDTVIHNISSWCRDEAALSFHFARDTVTPTLKALTWWTTLPWSLIEYQIGWSWSAWHTAFLADKANMQKLATYWNDIELLTLISNPAEPFGLFNFTPWDICVLSVKSFGANKDCSASMAMSEEI